MIIAFDIDDTITRHPAFFSLVSQALLKSGHRVLIITFRDEAGRAGTEADLAGWGIAYDELICWSMERCDLAEIDAWKAKVCRDHGNGTLRLASASPFTLLPCRTWHRRSDNCSPRYTTRWEELPFAKASGDPRRGGATWRI